MFHSRGKRALRTTGVKPENLVVVKRKSYDRNEKVAGAIKREPGGSLILGKVLWADEYRRCAILGERVDLKMMD